MCIVNKNNDEYFLVLYQKGLISVSNDGIVINIKTGRQLGSKPNNKGYHAIGWKENKKVHHMLIHRLVFLIYGTGFSVDKPLINHKDGNKSNNHIDNLEAVSNQENIQHAHETGLIPEWSDEKKEAIGKKNRGTNSVCSFLTEDDIVKIIQLSKTTALSHKKISEQFNVERSVVTKILNKKKYKDVWEKIENNEISLLT